MSKARIALHARSLEYMAGRIVAGHMSRDEAIDALNRMMEVFPEKDFDEGRKTANATLAPAFESRNFEPISWARGPVVIDRYAHSDSERRMEYEANWFAAALLMPENAFRSAWRMRDGDVADVATDFDVPIDVAKARAFALGLSSARTNV